MGKSEMHHRRPKKGMRTMVVMLLADVMCRSEKIQ